MKIHYHFWVTLAFIIFIIAMIFCPYPVFKFILQRYTSCPYKDYTLHADAIKAPNHVFYKNGAHNGGTSGDKNLLIWFHHGGLVASRSSDAYGLLNELYDALNDDKHNLDILTFDYPTVSYTTSVKDIMLYFNELFQSLNIAQEYRHIYGCGFSAGALLMGAHQAKEENAEKAKLMQVPAIGVKFSCLIAISGLLTSSFHNRFLDYTFKRYYFRGTPSYNLYSWFSLDYNSTRKLVITTQSDFLLKQSYHYVSRYTCEYAFFPNKSLDHCSLLQLNVQECQDTIKKIATFIRKDGQRVPASFA